MEETIRGQLQELMGLVYDLNENTDKQWFFSFSGHINVVGLYFYEKDDCAKCAHTETITTNVATVWDVNKLPNLIEKVKEFHNLICY